MARLTQDDLARITSQPGYTVGHCAIAPLAPRIPDAIAQHNARPESLDSDQAKEGGGAGIVLRITRHGTRLLDPDNLAGGCKPLIDALRYQGIIPEDNPAAIELVVKQRKVSKGETGTIIEINPTT